MGCLGLVGLLAHELDAEVALAGGGDDPLEAWMRPRKLGADPKLGGLGLGRCRAARAGLDVLRTVFPREAFASVEGASELPGPGLDTVEAEEAAVDDDENLADSVAGFVGNNIVAIESSGRRWSSGSRWSFTWLAGTAVQVRAPARAAGGDPSGARLSARQGGRVRRPARAGDAARPGRSRLLPREGERGERLDLRLSIPEERPQLDDLTEYEREALEFFDGLLEEGPADLGRLKDAYPSTPEVADEVGELRESLDRAEEGKLEWDRDLTRARSLLAFVALAGYIVIGLAYWDRTHQVAIPIFAALAGLLFIYLQPATSLKRLDPASRARHAQWNSFAADERLPAAFGRPAGDAPAVADLVYAVAFGTAEKVIASGRIPEPVMREATSGVWLVPHLGGVHSGVTPSFDGFASSFTSQVAPQSSSSGGGGGFSGGGGGFSGGGGGGAW